MVCFNNSKSSKSFSLRFIDNLFPNSSSIILKLFSLVIGFMLILLLNVVISKNSKLYFLLKNVLKKTIPFGVIVILLKDKSSIVLLTTDSKFYLDKNSDIIKVSVMTYSKYKLLKKGIKV
jgi:hypothetical protein